MKKYALPIVALLIIIASCNKKPTPTQSMADILRAGKWTVSSGTISMKLPSGKDTALNFLNFVPSCHHDDYIIFHAGNDAAIFSGATKCNPGDPDSTTFQWALSNSNTAISFYNGFTFTYSVVESILPFKFDTLMQSPYLELDTVLGLVDTTPGLTRQLIVLDTVWNLQFDTTTIQYNYIDNAQITAFSANQFTINYSIYSTYPDSLNHHTYKLYYTDPVTMGTDSLDYNPIIARDTFRYTITYTNG